jgi:hypothetical protein
MAENLAEKVMTGWYGPVANDAQAAAFNANIVANGLASPGVTPGLIDKTGLHILLVGQAGESVLNSPTQLPAYVGGGEGIAVPGETLENLPYQPITFGVALGYSWQDLGMIPANVLRSLTAAMSKAQGGGKAVPLNYATTVIALRLMALAGNQS